MKTKRISIWGSTGSIGTQTCEVVSWYRDRFEIEVLTAHGNVAALAEQARNFRPRTVVVTGTAAPGWEAPFREMGIETLSGPAGLLEAASRGAEDLVVNALVGSAGCSATMRALDAGSDIALANKEVLVMAGELITEKVREKDAKLLPIDSEHSAVFQVLTGENRARIRRILLTASGGPFREKTLDELAEVTVEQALAHPNWSMGKKVTIDSATLMNKGLEVIEARYLFDVDPEHVEVVIHPKSIVHSMVEFVDGSVKAQLGLPDMRVPISYALTWPDRWEGDYDFMDFTGALKLEFYPPDMKRFPALGLAYEALHVGGTAPAVINGADEVAVAAFLDGRIGFHHIPAVLEETLRLHDVVKRPSLEDILEADGWAKRIAEDEIVPMLKSD